MKLVAPQQQRLIDTFTTIITDANIPVLKISPLRNYAAPADHIVAVIRARKDDPAIDFRQMNGDDLALLIEHFPGLVGDNYYDLPLFRFFGKGTEGREYDLIVPAELSLEIREKIAREGRTANASGNEYCIRPATMPGLEDALQQARSAKRVIEAPDGTKTFKLVEGSTHEDFSRDPYTVLVLDDKAIVFAKYIAEKGNTAYATNPNHAHLKSVLQKNSGSVIALPVRVGSGGINSGCTVICGVFVNDGCSRLVVRVGAQKS